jgi:hypothetical protein
MQEASKDQIAPIAGRSTSYVKHLLKMMQDIQWGRRLPLIAAEEYMNLVPKHYV